MSMDRNLALEAVRVTEAGALADVQMMGRGDEKQADQAAVTAIRQSLNHLDIDGTVVIGEGERDEAPMLYIGEKVGTGHGPKIDIALDPLEGTTITAKGGQNALAVIAMADQGGFLNAPDVYMDKIAVGGGLPADLIDLTATPEKNLTELARAKKSRRRRFGCLHHGSPAPQRPNRPRPPSGGADHPDWGWRCGGGDGHRATGKRRGYLFRHWRCARRRIGRRRVALYWRANARAVAVPQ